MADQGKPVRRYNKVVGIRLDPDDEARFEAWVKSIPEAEGNRSLAFRIFLRRWADQSKPERPRRKGK